MAITPHATVEEFFHEVVVDALESQDVAVTEHTEFYLVGLLGEFTTVKLTDEPLAIKLVKSRDLSADQRFRALKEVGDTTLYVTGFFAESFDRKIYDPEYYIGLGEAAYAELAGAPASSTRIARVYGELAEKFPRFVDVLQEVRDRVSFATADAAKLYDQWRRTRSEWIEKRMRAMGLIVPPKNEESVH